jgi:hypothetical protein
MGLALGYFLSYGERTRVPFENGGRHAGLLRGGACTFDDTKDTQGASNICDRIWEDRMVVWELFLWAHSSFVDGIDTLPRVSVLLIGQEESVGLRYGWASEICTSQIN